MTAPAASVSWASSSSARFWSSEERAISWPAVRSTRSRGARLGEDALRLLERLAGVLACALLDLAGARLGHCDDRLHALGGNARDGRLLECRRLQPLDGLGDLAQVAIDLVRVIAPPRGWEVASFDVVALELHGSARLAARGPARQR
jgi:hypothetical protein